MIELHRLVAFASLTAGLLASAALGLSPAYAQKPSPEQVQEVKAYAAGGP